MRTETMRGSGVEIRELVSFPLAHARSTVRLPRARSPLTEPFGQVLELSFELPL